MTGGRSVSGPASLLRRINRIFTWRARPRLGLSHWRIQGKKHAIVADRIGALHHRLLLHPLLAAAPASQQLALGSTLVDVVIAAIDMRPQHQPGREVAAASHPWIISTTMIMSSTESMNLSMRVCPELLCILLQRNPTHLKLHSEVCIRHKFLGATIYLIEVRGSLSGCECL